MALYKQTEWQDRVTQYENRYTETRKQDGTLEILPYEGDVYQEGTPQNQQNFNNLEHGVQDTTLAASIWSLGFMYWKQESDAFGQALEAAVEEITAATEAGGIANDDLALAVKIYDLGRHYEHTHVAEHEALMDAETLGELQEITLTNNQRIPFNSTMDSPVLVTLRQARKNLFYSIETEVLEHTGEVGEIRFSGKALNAFRLAFTGDGTSVRLAVRVKGGMT